MLNEYTRWIRRIVKGVDAAPRGLPVRYIRDVVYPYIPGTVLRRTKDNPAVGTVEALQVIAGVFDIESIRQVAPNARLDLFSAQSAYGPRIGDQLPLIIDQLKRSPDTRRAQLLIASHDDTPETLPCATAMAFNAHAGLLSSTVFMRSSDILWGLPNDMIQFGILTQLIAHLSGLKCATVGSSIMVANSHIYMQIYNPHTRFKTDVNAMHLPNIGDTLQDYRLWAAGVLAGLPSRKEVLDVFSYTDYPVNLK